jgi:steroid delta-isomerase-like uncharacterized protein
VNFVEENLRTVDDFVEAFNKRDWDRVSSLHAESVVYSTPDNTEPLKGREKVRQVFVGYTGAFPDAHNKKERAFGMGDWVCVEYMFIGTHRGSLTGPDGTQVAGTGRSVRIPWVSLYRMAGGRITGWHAYWDALGMWKQLGH